MDSAYRHAPFDKTKRHWLTMIGTDTPFFGGLLEDPRFYEVAKQLYGEDVIGLGSDSDSVSRAGIKFVYYMQQVGENSGGLWVISGSHKNPFRQCLYDIGLLGPEGSFLKDSGLDINDIPSYVFDSEPGDVVAFDLRLWHSSWGGSNDRSMRIVL